MNVFARFNVFTLPLDIGYRHHRYLAPTSRSVLLDSTVLADYSYFFHY